MDRRAFLGTLGVAATSGCQAPSFGSPSATRTRTPGPFPSTPDPTDWPTPHYDARHTRRAPARDGLGFESDWHYPLSLDTRPASLPIVADNHLYVAYVGRRVEEDGRPSHLVALDAARGTRVWKLTFGQWHGAFEPPHGPLPVAHGDMVYFGPDSGAEAVGAFAGATGDRQWTTRSDDGQRLLLPGDGLLHLVRRSTGPDEGPSTVAGLDPLSGAVIWTTDFETRSPGYPTFDGDRVIYPLYGGSGTADQFVRLDPRNGRETGRVSGSVQPMAPVRNGLVYTAKWGSGRIAALDSRTGEVVWREDARVPHQMDYEGESITVNARYEFGGVTDGTVLVRKQLHGYRSDVIRAYDARSGDHQWEVGPQSDDGTVVTYNKPIVAGDSVYVTGTTDPTASSRSGFLREFDLASGRRRSSRSLPAASFVPPVAAGDRLFVVTWDGVHAFG